MKPPPPRSLLVEHPALPRPFESADSIRPLVPLKSLSHLDRHRAAVQLVALSALLAEFELWPGQWALRRAMAETSDYADQIEETARLVAEGARHERWQLAYQSRSGPPHVPWLGPDILEHFDALSQINVKDVVVAPIGFLSDHMEVVWDLDHEAREYAGGLGITLTRAATVGTHPAFVAMIRELIEERLGKVTVRQSLGKRGPYRDECPPDCCRYQPRVSRPPEPA